MLSLTFSCRPFTEKRTLLQQREPRQPWRDFAGTSRHHRRHHSNRGDALQPSLPVLFHVDEQGWAIQNTRECRHFLSGHHFSAPPFLACLNVSTASYKDFRVRKNNLFRFLHYLKEHNLYSSLSSALRTSTCQTMPAFGPLACRRCRQHSVSSFQALSPEQNVNTDADDSLSNFAPDELVQNKTCSFPVSLPLPPK